MVIAMEDFPIVVGYDGSTGAQEALQWALDEAAGRRAPLRLVCVIEMPVSTGSMFPLPFGDSTEAHQAQAQALLSEAAARAATTHPAVDVKSTMLAGPAAATLCELSHRARLLVLGSRGLGGVAGLFVGSTGIAVAAHAHCPVVVVRDGEVEQSAGGPIVVGFDDSPHALNAASFAFEEATMREADIVVVRAWTPPAMPWRSDVRPLTRDVAELETAERHSLELGVDGLAAKYPSVMVTTRLVAGDARHALTEASTGAQLVVVGLRGRGGFTGLILGSVSQYLLHHARCPVAVIPR
jgi:nucleotide-binding universal stress UspA family protein